MTDELVVGVAAVPPLRQRIAALLEHAGMAPAAEAASPEELARACEAAQPHVAVVSWAVCDDGAADLRRLAGRLPRTRMVVVIPSVDRRVTRAVLEAGADGVVVVSQMALTLALAVRSVFLGHVSIPRDAAADLDAQELSVREAEVLGLVAEGLGNAEIAARLCVTESTVKSHLAAVFTKLGVHTRTAAVAALRSRRQTDTARNNKIIGGRA